MTTEAETRVVNAQVKDSWQPQEIGRVKEPVLHKSLWKGCGLPNNTLISDFWPPEL